MNRKLVNFRIARSRSRTKFDNKTKVVIRYRRNSSMTQCCLFLFHWVTGRITGLLMIVITIVNIETFKPISLVVWSLRG